MFKKSVIILVLTVLVGGSFVFGADYWINAQERVPVVITKFIKPEIELKTVVVADGPMGFGDVLTASNLREVSWPQNALPPGAFYSIDELLENGTRVVLRPIETNEPILIAKITGSNESASLSKLIAKGHRAVTIRVNDVAGVAGFILPGDRVDVVLTREVTRISSDRRSSSSAAVADLLLQGVRVLTIDQVADERSEKPQVAKVVTLELNTFDAQKVALASSVGDLSLLLRSAGDQSFAQPKTINLSDLGGSITKELKPNTPTLVKSISQVVVRRPKDTQEYEVPITSN